MRDSAPSADATLSAGGGGGTSNLPEPLTPRDCDLRGYDFMPLFGHRLFNSNFDLCASDAEFRAAIRLWWAAWQQCPAASLPDDENALCRLAGLGRDLRKWRKIAARSMQGFRKCADGRLYHPILAEEAKEAYARRVYERDRKRKWRGTKETPASSPEGQDRDVTRDKTGTEQGRHGDGDGDVTADRTGQGQDRTYKSTPSLRSGDARATRLQADWMPSHELRAFARELGLKPEAVAAQFRDYWHAKPGKDATKTDWDATWRSWCRREAERRTQQPAHFRGGGGGGNKRAWALEPRRRDGGQPQPQGPIIEGELS